MADFDRYLAILVLRTLGCNQEDTASLVRCAKQTVVEAERWFTSCPQGEAFALVEDQRIRRLVGREFPDMGLIEAQLNRAGQLVGDDILLHYGWVGSNKNRATGSTAQPAESVPPPGLLPIYTELTSRHWERLREKAVALREQLSPPDVPTLFTAEVCKKAYYTVQSGSSLPLGYAWSRIFQVPVELRLSGSSREGTVEARLSVETEFLFPHLITHLQIEFSDIIQLEDYKKELGQLMLSCLQRVASVSRFLSRSSGMSYCGRDWERGLLWHFPSFICQFILNNVGSDMEPRLRTEPQPGGLHKLVAEESPDIPLALDNADHLSRCREVILKEIKDNTHLQVWREIYKGMSSLRVKANHLQALLATVIERGSFQGSCPLCQSYLTHLRPPEK